jgi:hypothetical protein
MTIAKFLKSGQTNNRRLNLRATKRLSTIFYISGIVIVIFTSLLKAENRQNFWSLTLFVQPYAKRALRVPKTGTKNVVYTLTAKSFNIPEIVLPRPQAASATIFLGTLKNDFAALIHNNTLKNKFQKTSLEA